MAFEFIQQSLANRQQQNLLRHRAVVDSSAGAMITVDGLHYLNFASNDYLGQRQSLSVMQAWVEGISTYGVGSGASPLVTGYTLAHQQLEDFLAQGLGRESALLFNSGFAANQAICQALLHKDALVISDKLMHASFVDSAVHNPATFKRFSHNDLSHLLSIMKTQRNDTLVATEGIFSMDGTEGDLQPLSQICQQQGAWLMVDDAHGIGVKGQQGLGSIEELNLSQQQVPIVMGTFGKAIGTAGAFVAGSNELITYLVNFAKHYVYSTSMPPALASATLASFVQLASGEQQQKLRQNIQLFKHLCADKFHLLPSNTAIQPLIVGEPKRALQLSLELRKLGIWVSAIRHPTVPKGSDRIRITLSASHHEQDIQALVDALDVAFAKLPGAER